MRTIEYISSNFKLNKNKQSRFFFCSVTQWLFLKPIIHSIANIIQLIFELFNAFTFLFLQFDTVLRIHGWFFSHFANESKTFNDVMILFFDSIVVGVVALCISVHKSNHTKTKLQSIQTTIKTITKQLSFTAPLKITNFRVFYFFAVFLFCICIYFRFYFLYFYFYFQVIF